MRERRWFHGLLLVGAVVAVYAPLLQRSGFIWDDNLLIFNSPQVIAHWSGLLGAWQGFRTPDYYPLTWTMFWLEWHALYPLGLGDNAICYHLVNMLLHAAGVVILWRALEAWRVPGAWYAALLFAVHPVAVGTVAWVAEGKSTLSFVLYALSLWWWARTLDEGAAAGWWVASWLAFVLALLAKTSGVLLPLALLMLEWWRHGQVRRASWPRLACFVAVAAGISVVAVHFQATRAISGATVHGAGEGAAFKLMVAGWELGFYLWKSLLPTGLAVLYPRWQLSASQPLDWLPCLGWVALAVLLWSRREPWGRGPLTALACWLLMLWPVLGFIDLYLQRFSFVEDHWQYLALVVPMVVVAAALERWRPRVLILLAVALAALSVQHVLVYRSRHELWTDNVARYPTSWMAWRLLADEELDAGDVSGAAAAIAEAARQRPDEPQIWFDWGRMADRQGDTAAALEKYGEALRLHPQYAEAADYRGVVHLHRGEVADAVNDMMAAVKIDPANWQAVNDLAWVAATTRDPHFRNPQAALELAARACQGSYFDNADFIDTLAAALAAVGDFDNAQRYCKQAIELSRQLDVPNVTAAALRHLASYERHEALRE